MSPTPRRQSEWPRVWWRRTARCRRAAWLPHERGRPARRQRTASPSIRHRRSIGGQFADRCLVADLATAGRTRPRRRPRQVRPSPPSGHRRRGPTVLPVVVRLASSCAARTCSQVGKLRNCREAEVIGVGRVDAADERIDESFVDLIAEPRSHVRADRVGLRIAAPTEHLGGGAQLAANRQQATTGPSRARRWAGRAADRRECRGGRSTTLRPCRLPATSTSRRGETAPARSTAHGTRARKASAPSSMAGCPANGVVRITPPSRSLCLEHGDLRRHLR